MTGLHARIGLDRPDGFRLEVQLDIESGSTVALLGPNGAGKSTTVAALAGLEPVDSGTITLAGRVLDDAATGQFVPASQRRVGVVFQDYLLFEHLSVEDNVMFGLLAAGQKRAEARTIAGSWIDRLDLRSLADRKPAALSGGQAQRVAVARVLAAEPDLLLLDEPLAALDVATRSSLRRLLAAHLQEFAGPRLLITHDPTDAFLLADEIVVIEEGRVTQRGAPDDIRRRPATNYVAAVAGTNLFRGVNDQGLLLVDGQTVDLRTADTATSGRVLITVHPTAVALHADQPHGSPRNSWLTRVAALEPLGDTTRVTLAGPLPLAADITPSAAASLALQTGSEVWVSIKATEIDVAADPHSS